MSSLTIEPVGNTQRLVNIDIIRGFALLGILLMNIQGFSMHFAAYSNPMALGEVSSGDYLVYYINHLFADQKFMTLFSTLFGVGIVLMATNIESKGGAAGKIHYKRMFILLIFGLLHAYMLWFGDILFGYALGGMIAYTMRKKSPLFLFITAFILIGITSLIMYSVGFIVPMLQSEDPNAYAEMIRMWAPTAQQIADDMSVNQLGWLDRMDHRHEVAGMMQGNVAFYLPRIVGLMCIGMALFKLDIFGERFASNKLIIVGVVLVSIGVFLGVSGINQNMALNWPLESMFHAMQYNYWGSIFSAYGYLCLFIVFCRSSILTGFKNRLANVGRMALTNYLSHSLICCFVFFGWGLGLYGTMSRLEVLAVVFGVWIFQLWFSTFWMARYKFGPVEWLWRTLTYSKMQPMKR